MRNSFGYGSGFTKSDRFRNFMRWFCYSLVLLLLYMIMVSGLFRGWQPLLIIPLAIAVAMREKEISSSVFGAMCGLIIDIAANRLFGFTGIWLLPSCLLATLLVSHLIKNNLLNFVWLTTATCVVVATMDYFFNFVVWGVPNSHFILTDFIIPSHLSAIVLSPLMYFAVKKISNKFSLHEKIRLSSMHDTDDSDDYKISPKTEK
ncbi:MAG: hypothetical protein FWF76_03500 [Oscillospiraceae bacterium]|nr:hypothetical protein [Oscillospiraceae bacterium]